MAPPASADADVRRELRARFGEEWLDFAELWSPAQREILLSDKRFIFAFGGNGAGKTTLGSWWVRMHLARYNPITGAFWKRPQPANIYCVGVTESKVHGAIMPALRRWLPKNEIVKEERKEGIWHLRDEAKIFFKTGNQDVETFGSDEIDACWIDEELSTRAHWDEVLARIARRLGVVLNSLTPANGTLWLHSWVFSPDEYPMERKTIARVPMDANPYYFVCDTCLKPRAWHQQKRGKACDTFSNALGQQKLEEAKLAFHVGSTVYKIRFEGHYLLNSGGSVISPEVRERMEKAHRRDPVCGYLNAGLSFIHVDDPHDSRAWLRIQVGIGRDGQKKLLLPEPGRQYVCGVDVGGGNPMGDFHAAVVFDYETGEQVALAHTRSCEPRDFGILVDQLGRFYNDAFMVVEINNHGFAAVGKLSELGYGNIFRRQRVDGVGTPSLPRLGFFTDVKSKPAAVDIMVDYFTNRWKIHDPIIFAEAFHYTWLKDNREGTHRIGNSNPSGHDDTMSALFLAAWGLRSMGWLTGAFAERAEAERKPSVGEMLLADASGEPVTEGDLLDSLAAQENPGYVEDGMAEADDISGF